MGRNPKIRKIYYIYCDGEMVEVSEEVYRLYYGSKRSELYQHEKESKNKVVYFSDVEHENIDNMLIDYSVDVERQILSDLLIQTIKREFTKKEFEIIDGLYIQGMSMRELAEKLGISYNAVLKRKNRVYPKIKNFLEKYYEKGGQKG